MSLHMKNLQELNVTNNMTCNLKAFYYLTFMLTVYQTLMSYVTLQANMSHGYQCSRAQHVSMLYRKY